MTTETVNLDAKCAKCGYTIVFSAKEKSKVENVVTKSLGVLQEQGVYAFFLFLDHYQRRNEGKGAADSVRKYTLELLQTQEVVNGMSYEDLHNLTANLDNLLLARELLEQTLIYARYHAKALVEKDDKQAEESTA